jgi:hypothetical protein
LSKKRLAGILIVAVLLSGSLGSCHLRPLLSDVTVSPDVISPNADGNDDATNISYSLSRNADLSIYFVDADGTRFHFREARPRSPGDYQVQWGGVVNQPYSIENEYGHQQVMSWVLPDGTYTWVVEAVAEDGEVAQVEGQISLSGGDAQVPALRQFTVALPEFTPNQDGLRDRTGFSYVLNKDVASVLVYLYDPAAPELTYPVEEQEQLAETGKAGYHYYDYDGGVDRGAQPPPDGTYVVAAEARDLSGYHVVVTDTVTIVDGGKPRGLVVNGSILWSDAMRSVESAEVFLPLGSTLCFTTYVENYSTVPLRTSGPASGTTYKNNQNYNTLAVEMGDDSFHEQPGAWRFGVNFDVSLIDFPYRWAVGKPEELRCETIEGQEQCFLDPGRRGTVAGCIELVEPFPRTQVFAWGGLIHQWVGIDTQNNYVDRISINSGTP